MHRMRNAANVLPEGVIDMVSGKLSASHTPQTDLPVSVVVGELGTMRNIYDKAVDGALRVLVTTVVGIADMVDALNTSEHPQIQSFYRADPMADDTHPSVPTK
jgi:hypothetical protein